MFSETTEDEPTPTVADAWDAADTTVRTVFPQLARLFGQDDYAARFEALAPITSTATARAAQSAIGKGRPVRSESFRGQQYLTLCDAFDAAVGCLGQAGNAEGDGLYQRATINAAIGYARNVAEISDDARA